MHLPRIIFLVGPTSVGKTEIACRLAEKIGGEVVSCDSMQVYREIEIANNKPSAILRKRAPHHLVDLVSVVEDFDVSRFKKMAEASIRDILKRERVPVVVGGSGLYMSVLLDGIFDDRVKDDALRQKLSEVAQKKGNEFLHKKLLACDPKSAAKIHPSDRRRLIRALEVFELTGVPISDLQKKREGLWGQFPICVFGLNRERAELYARIDQRVKEMFKEGIVEEVKKLSKFTLSQTSAKIIGFKEISEFLRGDKDLLEAQELMQQNTRRYAKRQLTWFRKDSRIEWLMLEESSRPPETVQKIIERLENK